MNISEKVRERFEIPCYVENDVNCAAMAEALSGSRQRTFLYADADGRNGDRRELFWNGENY